MKPLPPGTILQLMYLRERLENIQPGRFVEIGPGSGEITALLLELGWRGCSCDLEEVTIARLRNRFCDEVAAGKLEAFHGDFLMLPDDSVNLIISCMVMEHLDEDDQKAFMDKAALLLKDDGQMIGLVPASPVHWGIEDDIAGHFRRYTRGSLQELATVTGWRLLHSSGLTYPVSNILLPVSNYLVKRKERKKLELSVLERTRLSGRRSVLFKTRFPSFFGLLLNRVVMYPFHILQKKFGNNDNSLVLYFEARHVPDTKEEHIT